MNREDVAHSTALEARLAEADSVIQRGEELTRSMKDESEPLAGGEETAEDEDYHDVKPDSASNGEEFTSNGEEFTTEVLTVVQEVRETRLEIQETGEGVGQVVGQAGESGEGALETAEVTYTSVSTVEAAADKTGALDAGTIELEAAAALGRPEGTSDVDLFGEVVPSSELANNAETVDLITLAEGQLTSTQGEQLAAPASVETHGAVAEDEVAAAEVPSSVAPGFLSLALEGAEVNAAAAGAVVAHDSSMPTPADAATEAAASGQQAEFMDSETPIKLEHKFSVGEKVEACTSEEGLRGAWFSATILQIEESTARVKFDELLNDDGVTKLEELYPMNPPWTISISPDGQVAANGPGDGVKTLKRVLRPFSTAESAFNGKKRGHDGAEVSPWSPGDQVEVSFDDAWWEAIVTAVSGKNITVYYPGEVDAGVVSVDDVRPALVLVDGFWVVNKEKAAIPPAIEAKGATLSAPEKQAKRQKTEENDKLKTKPRVKKPTLVKKKEKPMPLIIGGKTPTPKKPLLMMTVKQAKRQAEKEKKAASEGKAAAKKKLAKETPKKATPRSKTLVEGKKVTPKKAAAKTTKSPGKAVVAAAKTTKSPGKAVVKKAAKSPAKSPLKRTPAKKKPVPQAKANKPKPKTPSRGAAAAKKGIKVGTKKVTVRTPAKKTPLKSPATKAASKPLLKKVPPRKAAPSPKPKSPAKKPVRKSPAKKLAAKSSTTARTPPAPAAKVATPAPAQQAAAKLPVKKAMPAMPAKKPVVIAKKPVANVGKKHEAKSPQKAAPAPKRSTRSGPVVSPQSPEKPVPAKVTPRSSRGAAKQPPAKKAATRATPQSPPKKASTPKSTPKKPTPRSTTRAAAATETDKVEEPEPGPASPPSRAAKGKKAVAKPIGKAGKPLAVKPVDKTPEKPVAGKGKGKVVAKAKAEEKAKTPASARSTRSAGPALDQAQAVQQALAEAKALVPSKSPANKTPEVKSSAAKKQVAKGKGKGVKNVTKSPALTPSRATVVIEETRVTRRSLTVVSSPGQASAGGTAGKRKRDADTEKSSRGKGETSDAAPSVPPQEKKTKVTPKPAKGAEAGASSKAVAKKGKQEAGSKRQKKEVAQLLEASLRTTRNMNTSANPPPVTVSPATRQGTRGSTATPASGDKRKRGKR